VKNHPFIHPQKEEVTRWRKKNVVGISRQLINQIRKPTAAHQKCAAWASINVEDSTATHMGQPVCHAHVTIGDAHCHRVEPWSPPTKQIWLSHNEPSSLAHTKNIACAFYCSAIFCIRYITFCRCAILTLISKELIDFKIQDIAMGKKLKCLYRTCKSSSTNFSLVVRLFKALC